MDVLESRMGRTEERISELERTRRTDQQREQSVSLWNCDKRPNACVLEMPARNAEEGRGEKCSWNKEREFQT